MPGEDDNEAGADPGAANRGAPASVSPGGEVHGSGSGAGGGGSPEEFDPDSVGGGGGDVEPRTGDQPDRFGDASNHGSR